MVSPPRCPWQQADVVVDVVHAQSVRAFRTVRVAVVVPSGGPARSERSVTAPNVLARVAAPTVRAVRAVGVLRVQARLLSRGPASSHRTVKAPAIRRS